MKTKRVSLISKAIFENRLHTKVASEVATQGSLIKSRIISTKTKPEQKETKEVDYSKDLICLPNYKIKNYLKAWNVDAENAWKNQAIINLIAYIFKVDTVLIEIKLKDISSQSIKNQKLLG